jgi:hypothetical protein
MSVFLDNSGLSTAVDKHVGNFPFPHLNNQLKMNGFRLSIPAMKRPSRPLPA